MPTCISRRRSGAIPISWCIAPSRRRSPAGATRASTGTRSGCTARRPSGARTKRAATWRTGSSVSTCRSTSGPRSRDVSPASRHSACSSRWTSTTSTACFMCQSSAATISVTTQRGTSCWESAPGAATGSPTRSASSWCASTSSGARSTSSRDEETGMSRHGPREPRVVFGFHTVLALLRSDPGSVIEIFLDESRLDARARDLAATAERLNVRVLRVPAKRLDGFYGGGRHQGVVARVEVKSTVDSLDDVLERISGPALLLVLDGVTDPHNLGACLRIANAAGAHAVIAPKDRAAGITPAVSKVASGAAEATPYIMVTNLARTLAELKERNIWIVGADERADKTLYETGIPEAVAWVLGAEGEGMRRLTRESCDVLVRIPMRGEVESLNVSVAAGVVLFESARQRAA